MAPIRNHARHSRYSSNFASSSGSPGYRSNGGSRWDAGEVEDGLHPDFVWPEGHRPGQGPCDHILPAFYEVDGPPVVDLQAFRSLAATIVNMYNRGGQGGQVSWDDQELQRLLGRYRLALHNVILGLRRWGCFQIVNHGVPQEVVNSLSTAVRTFFAKSSQEKHDAVVDIGGIHAGYTGPWWPAGHRGSPPYSTAAVVAQAPLEALAPTFPRPDAAPRRQRRPRPSVWSESVTLSVPTVPAWPNHTSSTWSIASSSSEIAPPAGLAAGHHAHHTFSAATERATTVLDRVAPLLAIRNTSDWVRTAIKRYVYNLEGVADAALDLVEAAFKLHPYAFRRDLGVVRTPLQGAGGGWGAVTAALAAAVPDGHRDVPVRVLGLERSPACPEPGLTWAVPARSHRHALALLHQDCVGGLQVQSSREAWVRVSPRPDCFVVLAGDLLQAWSNDQIKSAQYRVVPDARRDRLTMAVTYNPPLSTMIRPPPELVARVPGYITFGVGEFIGAADRVQGPPNHRFSTLTTGGRV